jgi:hypothetical protein
MNHSNAIKLSDVIPLILQTSDSLSVLRKALWISAQDNEPPTTQELFGCADILEVMAARLSLVGDSLDYHGFPRKMERKPEDQPSPEQEQEQEQEPTAEQTKPQKSEPNKTE